MTMKSQPPVHPKTDMSLHWHLLQLPVGLQAAAIKTSTDGLDLPLPPFHEKGLTLTFINYKGELRIRPAHQPGAEEATASPGLGLLSVAGQPLVFLSSEPIVFSALVLFIPAGWIALFLRQNTHFKKIEQVLEEEGNIITCRLGRRQMSLFSSALGLL